MEGTGYSHPAPKQPGLKWVLVVVSLVAGHYASAQEHSSPPSASGSLLPESESSAGVMVQEVCPRWWESGLLGHFLYSDEPVNWSRVPQARIFPRPGDFPVPPTGPGYYSLHDWLTGNYRTAPPKFPYLRFGLMPPSFFDADFRYLDDPNNTDYDWSDFLHRIHIGDNWLFATGGAFWVRYMHEINSRLSGADNDYTLLRTRVWTDLWYRDLVRVYAEFLDAHSFDPELPPLRIDVNRSDFLNAFVEFKVGDWEDHPIYVRIGRQEMLLGSQRLISTLDWANTRRTFDGIRGYRQGEKWDVDVFWLQPVIPNPSRLDSKDNNQNFFGLWTTYRPRRGTFLDMYYLLLDNTNNVLLQGLQIAPYHVHTLGSRYAGDWQNRWLWDVEAAVQFGERGSQDILAGMVTTGVGYTRADWLWTPTFWVYYDFASGDRTPNSGDYNTFNQLFPFGHYYMGWIDLVGRQNIHDFNMHLFLYPAKWITVWIQYHRFWLVSPKDALYGVAGLPSRTDLTGSAGNDVGHELDLIFNFHLSNHSDILLGWSKLYAGDFIKATGPGQSPELFYFMYTFRW
ncbi:MAG: alginate export family protein [Gemmatales bacterium]|nr:alginate export family protein [Gemmatales bacterium]MDW8176101.1 alginate export family protein [Gemmatales bacterium]